MTPLLRDGQTSFRSGMNDTAAASEYASDEVANLVNGRLGFDGTTCERRDGSERTHSSALNSGKRGWGGAEFVTAGGTHQIVVFVGDKAYYSTNDGKDWTEIASGLRTDRWSTAIMRVGSDNLLICANGASSVYKWDGSSWGTLSGAPSGVQHVAVFNDRLYVAGHDGVTVKASEVGDPETWNTATSGAFSVRVQTHDGDSEIKGLFQLGTVLLVFKQDSTNYIEGFGTRTITVEAAGRGVSRSVGCLAPDSIRACGDQGVAWLSERGFEFWAPGRQIELISRPVQQFMDGISWADIIANDDHPTALWWPKRHEYWCALPTAGSQNDQIFVYRTPTRRFPSAIYLFRPQAQEGDTMTTDSDGYLQYEASATEDQVDTVGGYLRLVTGSGSGRFVTKDANGYLQIASADWMPAELFLVERADSGSDVNFPYSVGYDGFVRRMEVGDKDDVSSDGSGGEDVQMELTPRPFLFGDRMRRAWVRTIRVLAESDDSFNVTVTPRVDGSDQTAHTLNFSSSQEPVKQKARVTGRGHRCDVKIKTTDKVRVAGVELVAKPLRESA